MGLVTIQNGESGLDVRNALNSMFAELYSSFVSPLVLSGIIGDTSIPGITGNSFIDTIGINATSNTNIQIGITPGGSEIVPAIDINGFQLIVTQYYLESDSTIYITFNSGSVTLGFRFNIIYSYL